MLYLNEIANPEKIANHDRCYMMKKHEKKITD